MRKQSEHPGKILLKQYLVKKFPFSYHNFANELGLEYDYFLDFIEGLEPVTLELANKLASFCGTSPQYWMMLQNEYSGQPIFGGHSGFNATDSSS